MSTLGRHKGLASYGYKNYENNNKLKEIRFHDEDEWGLMLVSYIRRFNDLA